MIEYPIAFPEIAGSYRALLPRKAMSEILKLAAEAGDDALISFAGDDNHLFFQLGDRLLMSRKLSGNFPDFERVLPRDQPNRISLQKDEFKSAIERVSQFADERSHAIRVRLCPGEAKVHSSITETGESEESLPVEYDGPTVEIGFNAQYLLDFLRAIPQEQIVLQFKDSNSAGEFGPGGDANDYVYRYVVMPMRI
jgi:DNA polymerase-3 subunit beta